jgi:hypothetical protein
MAFSFPQGVSMGFRLIFLVAVLAATGAFARAQSNLLQNPNADLQSQFWRAYGQATVESCATNNPCFVLRNGGYFAQDVNISSDAVGGYAVLAARASTERVNPDGSITGLPSLYGYMMDAGNPRGGRVFDYLQGQNMSARHVAKNEWVTLWGIFQVPEGTARIRVFLNQALARDVPHDGSATRFDDIGVYLFTTKQEAQSFVTNRP